MIGKLSNGYGTKAMIWIDGKEMEFKLAIMARKTWDDQEEFEYGFITEDGLYSRGFYSGGTTGFGISNYEVEQKIPDRSRVVTTDLNDINEIAEREQNRANLEHEEITNSQNEKIKEINSLPKFSLVHPELDDVVVFERSDAEFRPSHSSAIQGGTYSLKAKKYPKTIWLNDYKTKDDKLLTKKFSADMKYNFDGAADKMNPKDLLTLLLNKERDLNRQIKIIKDNN